MRSHRHLKLHRLLVQIRFLKKNFAGINFRGLDKSKHFAGTNFCDFVRKPQKLVCTKISTNKVSGEIHLSSHTRKCSCAGTSYFRGGRSFSHLWPENY